MAEWPGGAPNIYASGTRTSRTLGLLTPEQPASREGEEEQRHGSCAVAVPSHTGDMGLAICWLRKELHPCLLLSGQVPCLLKQPLKGGPALLLPSAPWGGSQLQRKVCAGTAREPWQGLGESMATPGESRRPQGLPQSCLASARRPPSG